MCVGLVPYLCLLLSAAQIHLLEFTPKRIKTCAALSMNKCVYFAVLHFEIRLGRTTIWQVWQGSLRVRARAPARVCGANFFITAACWCWLNPKGWSHLGWCNAAPPSALRVSPCECVPVQVPYKLLNALSKFFMGRGTNAAHCWIPNRTAKWRRAELVSHSHTPRSIRPAKIIHMCALGWRCKINSVCFLFADELMREAHSPGPRASQ